MAAAVHREGGKIFGQIWYHPFQVGQWGALGPPRPSLGPSSAQMFGHNECSHALRRDELRSVIDAYRRSGSNLSRAGYDGIELSVCHGTLLEQFASPYFNQRADEYGASPGNRLRLVFECLEATHDGAGDQVAVGIRFNCDEMLPGGYNQADAAEMLREICQSGLVDFVDLDVAVEPNQFHLGMPSVFVNPHVYEPYVVAMRDAAGSVPVISVLGRLTSVAEAETAIANGVCDMVGAARALIAEPDLVRNARDGKEDRSRTCIACNWCMAAVARNAAGCAINPVSYRERIWGGDSLAKAATRVSKVVVVGGGPAGLEAARVAALRGHAVVLLESCGELGGGLRLWAKLPGREWFQKGVDWWVGELTHLGVDVRLGIDATAATVLGEQPDAVIVATGSRYSRAGRSGFLNQEISGYDQDFVYRPEDILLEGVRPKGKVVLLDGEGSHAGPGIAELLGNAGADVELVTSSFAPVGSDLMFTGEVGFVVGRMKAAGVTISAQTYLRSIGNHAVTVYDVFTEADRIISDVEAVVLATSREPNGMLTDALEGKVTQLFTVGDALAPRPMASASFEGQKFARLIGEPGAPTTFNEAFWPDEPYENMPQPAAVLLDRGELAAVQPDLVTSGSISTSDTNEA
jgi:2,4-dienoyl-CoA reductase-like NADH-dependent reductase (Old Yellow Enzyme family)